MSLPQFDAYLGAYNALKPYRLKSILKDTAPATVPRFATTSEGQSDLDLLKIGQVKDVEAGMFQQEWDDEHRVKWIEGLYNPVTRRLHPTVPKSAATGYTTTNSHTGAKISAKVQGYGTIFWAEKRGATTNVLFKMDSAGTVTTITLPAAVSGVACSITGLSFHKQYLIINGMESGTTTFNTQRMDLAALTFQDLGGAFNKTATLNGVLYGIQSESNFYLITNETIAGAATFTQLKIFGIGSSTISPILWFDEYNGALYFAKYEGLYRFDGVDARKALNLRTYYNTVWNGRMYFIADGWFYSFDGGVLTRIQFFGTAHNIIDMTSWQDRVAILSIPSYTDIVSEGYNEGFNLTTTSRIFSFDGVGMTIATDEYLSTASTLDYLMICGNEKYLLCVTEGAALHTNSASKFDLSYKFKKQQATTKANNTFGYTTSEFTAGFPDVWKSLEGIQIEYFDILAGDAINVYYSIDGAAYVGAGSISTTSPSAYIELHNIRFKKIKVRFVGTTVTNSYLSIRSGSISYTLQPRYRNRWQVGIPIYNDGQFNALEERAGASTTTDMNEQAKNLDSMISSQYHSYFMPLDFGRIKTTVNSAATSFIVKGQFNLNDPPSTYDNIEELPMVAVLNASSVWEIMRVTDVSYNSGTDETTITILARGYLGITAASLTAGNDVRLCYKVFVNRLARDATLIDVEHYNEQATTGESQIQREYQIEVIEV